jgi:ankyrin repeat protein
MELAVTEAWESPAAISSASNAATPVDVVRVLLTLGADPNAGLEIATKVHDGAVLAALLDAGAKTDHQNDHGPVVFEWLAVMPLANFTTMLDHGMNPNLTDRSGTPLIVAAAQQDRWDFVLLLMSRGATTTRGDAQGVRLADVVQSRVESTTERPAKMKADIARVKSQLGAAP